MNRYFVIQGGKVRPCEEVEAQIMLVVNPDTDIKEQLVGRWHIDEHTLGSSLDFDELARLEHEDDHAAIIFKRPKNYSAKDMLQFKVSSMGIFLFADQVVVVTDSELPLMDEKRFGRITSLKSFVLRVLNYSVFHFTEHLKIINRISDELEQKIESSMENQYLLHMFSLGKGLTYYLNAVNSNAALLQRMSIGNRLAFDEGEREQLEDLVIENSQCLRQAEIYSNILSSMMDARASIVSNNLNILMKTLNIVTIGIMVPTFVVSAFSMNVHIPMQDNPYAFAIIMSLAISAVAVFIWIYRSKKW